MAHELDHVFVLCAREAPEAESLVRLGLKEGSPNTHPGQGTACRRFFFGNAYLELVFVCDEAEAASEVSRPTRLLERWAGRLTGLSPFGIVLRPSGAVASDPPFPSWAYRPSYLPKDLSLEIATGTRLTEPELFYWRLPRRKATLQSQPVDHATGWREITGLCVGIPEYETRTEPVRMAEATGAFSCTPSTEHVVTLEIDDGRRQVDIDLRPALPLVFRA